MAEYPKPTPDGDEAASGQEHVEPCGTDYGWGTWENNPISEATQDVRAANADQEGPCVECPEGQEWDGQQCVEVGDWVRFTTPQITCEEKCTYDGGNDEWDYNAGGGGTLFKVRPSHPFHLGFRPTKIRLDVVQTGLSEWNWVLYDEDSNIIATLPTLITSEGIIETDNIDFDTYGFNPYEIGVTENPTTGSLRNIWYFVPVDPSWLYMVPNSKQGGSFPGSGWDSINSGIVGGTPNDGVFITLAPSEALEVGLSELSWEGGLVDGSGFNVRIRMRSPGTDNFRILTFWTGTTPDDNFTFPLASTDFQTYLKISANAQHSAELAGATILLQNQSGTQNVDISEFEVELIE